MSEMPRSEASASCGNGDIAIVGVACRFGGDASDEQRLWKLLCDGRSASEPCTREGGHPDRGYYLRQDPYAFDADFFGISHREARAVDPNHRMLLEVTYEALEQAGLTLDAVAGSNTSCFVGQFTDDYGHMLSRDTHGAPMYTATGSNSAISASRISHFYDFKGPSYTLNTACSSGMVALHAACESIRKEGVSMAVAASSNLILTGDMAAALGQLNFLSADGTCKSFDISADGYARGEGVTSLILRPVQAAIDAREPIRAIIRGSGVNHNGRGERPGITVPSVSAQTDLIAATYRSAGLDYGDTNYVEAHGTGTQAGDPVEMKALSSTIGRNRATALLVGSSKPNLGHTEASAGMAGIIKVMHILEHGTIPPNILLSQPNPEIRFKDWNLEVPQRLTPWPTTGVRRASVCSTGYGGVNAHVILDDATHYLQQRALSNSISARYLSLPPNTKRKTASPRQHIFGEARLLILRAQDQDGLDRQAVSLRDWLEKLPNKTLDDTDLLSDLSHTLNNERSSLSWSSTVVSSSLAELKDELASTGSIVSRAQQSLPSTPSVCLIFTGQGAQWPRMGAQLYEHSSIFRRSVDAADHHLKERLRCTWSVVDELWRPKDSSKIHEPQVSQALCTVLQVALVDLLEYWRVKIDYVAGHSSGEIAAAHCLGAISREAAWEIGYWRGQLTASLDSPNRDDPGAGGMLAVGAPAEDAEAVVNEAGLEGKVVVACYNSPQNVTLSGDSTAIDVLQQRFDRNGTFARRLKVGVAYHSHHMESIAAAYFRALRRIRPTARARSERIMFSTVTGEAIHLEELGPRYFVDNLLSPVKFAPAVEAILSHVQSRNGTEVVFVEAGPHAALKGPLKQIIDAKSGKLTYTSLMVRGEGSNKTAFHAAGALHALGVPVDLLQVNRADDTAAASKPRIITDLPPYQWNHSTSYKGLSRYMEQHEQHAGKMGALLGARLPTVTQGCHTWRRYLNPSKMPWLYEHRIDGTAVYPAAGHLIAVLEAVSQLADTEREIEFFSLREVAFHAPIIIPKEGSIEMSVEMRQQQSATRERTSASWMAFTISSSRDGAALQSNCTGQVKVEYHFAADSAVARERADRRRRQVEAHKANSAQRHDEEAKDDFYAHLERAGIDYGPPFQMLSGIYRGPTSCSFQVQNQLWQEKRHKIVHPGTLDSMIHSAFAACNVDGTELRAPMVPALIQEMEISAALCSEGTQRTFFGSSTVARRGFLGLEGDVSVFDTSSQDLSVHVRGMRMQSTGNRKITEAAIVAPRGLCSSLTWESLDTSTPQIESGTDFCIVFLTEPSARVRELSLSINAALSKSGHHCVERRWPLTSSPPRSERCILLDIESPVLVDCDEPDLHSLQTTLTQVSHLLWVSADNAPGSIVTGLARAVRHEMPSLEFRTLQVGAASLARLSGLASTIGKIACMSAADTEVRESAGELEVPRVVENEAMDKRAFAMQLNSISLIERPLSSVQSGAVLTVQQPGDLSTLCFRPDAISSETPLGPDEVAIEVRTTGLNFRDLMVAIGSMPDLLMGFDAAGIVTAVGSNVVDLDIGDRVCVLYHGSHRSHIRSPSELVQPIPDDMPFEKAATLPLVFATVYNALQRVARAEKGQTVLIHSGGGGVGQTAIQLAQHLGLVIITTVGSDAKRAFLRERYGISDERILASRDLSFVDAVDRLTDGRGVDIVLNQLAGEFQRQTWNCIAPGGVFVELGFKDIQNNASLDMQPFAQDATFCFFNIARMIKDARKAVGRLLKESFELLRQGVLQPIEPLTTFDIESATDAFRTVQTGKHMGKSALIWKPEATLPMILPAKSATRLDPHATYLLSGGLGGVGRSVAFLLAEMGARHLCFLSRSGGGTEQAQYLLAELKERSVQASVYKADVADETSLSQALVQCRKDNPPIKGVLQLAMVLRDGLFENMSISQWRDSIRPKVHGSRNLDKAFGNDVDFFIMLSSFAGIFGNPTQSNYAAGCAYQDALIHERQARGCLRSVSIDLGIMKGVGYFENEQRNTGHLAKWQEPFGLNVSELHALLRLAIGGETDAQVIAGLPTATSAAEAGVERPFFLDDLKFAQLAQDSSDKHVGGKSTVAKGLEHDISKASTDEEVRQLATDAIVNRVAASLQIDENAVQLSQPLHSHGVDSLVAVEIRSWISQELKTDVSTLELTGNASLGSLADQIIADSPITEIK